MSLIQEALKRQQEEYDKDVEPGGASAGGESQPPPLIPDNPPPAAVEPPEPPELPQKSSGTNRPWFSMLGVILLGVLILVGAGGVILLAMRHMAGSSSGKSAARSTDTASVRRTKIIDTKAPARAAKVAANVAERAAETEFEQPSQVVPAETTEPAETEQQEPADVPAAPPPRSEPAPPSAQSAQSTEQTRQPAPADQPLRWPNLKLTGVLASSVPGEGAARINGTMVFVGHEIEGVTLVRIYDEGVLLRYGEDTKFLRVGAILY